MPNFDTSVYRNTVKVHRHTDRLQRYYPSTLQGPDTYIPETPNKSYYECSFDDLLFDFITKKIETATFKRILQELLRDFGNRGKPSQIDYYTIRACSGVKVRFHVQKRIASDDSEETTGVITCFSVQGHTPVSDDIREVLSNLVIK